jgi:hypothetical protein
MRTIVLSALLAGAAFSAAANAQNSDQLNYNIVNI